MFLVLGAVAGDKQEVPEVVVLDRNLHLRVRPQLARVQFPFAVVVGLLQGREHRRCSPCAART